MTTARPTLARTPGHRRIDPAVVGPSIALIVMFVIYSVLSPHFLTMQNVTNVLVQCAPLLILAAGQCFAVLMGGLDLSQGCDRQPGQRRHRGRHDGPRAGRSGPARASAPGFWSASRTAS